MSDLREEINGFLSSSISIKKENHTGMSQIECHSQEKLILNKSKILQQ